jgi:hypothetical protein
MALCGAVGSSPTAGWMLIWFSTFDISLFSLVESRVSIFCPKLTGPAPPRAAAPVPLETLLGKDKQTE